MKTFLNVLYRRILYKIPLKLLLVLLAVFCVLFACFSNADFQDSTFSKAVWWNNVIGDKTYTLPAGYNSFCLYATDSVSNCTLLTLGGNTVNKSIVGQTPLCYVGINGGTSLKYNCRSSIYEMWLYSFNYNEPYDSLQCQTQYNLIPISSVDENYCTTNNLCPSCPVCPSVPVGTGGYSQLYINNILHLGAPNIIMNIPDEIDWDYAYTQGGQNMNIDVVGYNVDYEKIDSIVQFQNYKPTSEDFQKIIGLLAPYTKIIVFFVFLFIVWAWIKKPFKSKKL